jgi:hypothetical protein
MFIIALQRSEYGVSFSKKPLTSLLINFYGRLNISRKTQNWLFVQLYVS